MQATTSMLFRNQLQDTRAPEFTGNQNILPSHVKRFNEIKSFYLTTGSEEDGDYQEIFPIYFGWNDLVKTCQEYVRAFAEEGEEYEAAISVSELNQLVEQMKQPSPEDFRNVQFVPASPRPLDT